MISPGPGCWDGSLASEPVFFEIVHDPVMDLVAYHEFVGILRDLLGQFVSVDPVHLAPFVVAHYPDALKNTG